MTIPAAPAAPQPHRLGGSSRAATRPAGEDAFVAAVERALARLFSDGRRRWQHRYPQLALGFDALESFVLGGGKRLRPRFAHWGCRAAGGDPTDPRLVDVGAAIELFHAFALIHDDVMDGSDVRRHQPTVHRRFAAHHTAAGWRGEERRVAEGFAILLGDLAFAYSTGLLAGVPPAVAAVFDEMRIELHVGQYLDLVCAADDAVPDHVVDDINRYKTSSYSVQRPLQLGAALAGAGGELVDLLDRWGALVGEAFQHRDDLLGVFGDPEVTGKPAGDDLVAGKATMLLRRTQAAPGAARVDAVQRVGTARFGADDVAEVRAFMLGCGAVDAVEARIRELVDGAHDLLRGAAMPLDAGAGLRRMADAAAWRIR